MRQYIHLFLSALLSSLIVLSPVNAAEFNIKLRKTDINELKQQFLPIFEQNIVYLNQLLKCLEGGKTVDYCLNEFSHMVEKNVSEHSSEYSLEKQERNKKIKADIQNKIDKKNIEPEAIIPELKKLIAEAEEVKSCLYKGQTANELKDCIIGH